MSSEARISDGLRIDKGANNRSVPARVSSTHPFYETHRKTTLRDTADFRDIGTRARKRLVGVKN